MLFRSSAPEDNSDGENNNRSIKSRSGHLIRLCDRSGQESIEIVDKTGNNKIVIATSGNKISIEAQGDIDITSQTGKLTLSAVGIDIKSQAGIQMQANANIDVTATAQVNVKGVMVNVN